MKAVQSKSVEKIPNWIFSLVHLRPGGGRCAIIAAACRHKSRRWSSKSRPARPPVEDLRCPSHASQSKKRRGWWPPYLQQDIARAMPASLRRGEDGGRLICSKISSRPATLVGAGTYGAFAIVGDAAIHMQSRLPSENSSMSLQICRDEEK
jgi:hypothetical protein